MLLLWLLIPMLAALAFGPTLAWLWEAWWSDPYYSHGPLIIAISALLVWRSRARCNSGPLSAGSGPQAWAGIVLLGLGLALHGSSVLWRGYYLSALGAILVLLGLTLYLLGGAALRELFFPIAFLAFAIPLPLAEQLGPPLEVFTATQATNVVRFFGIPALNEGSRVLLPGSAFSVGAPCSGLRSLAALVALAALLAYLVRGPLWTRLVLLLAAVPAALAANLVRVASLFTVAYAWGPQAGLTYYHELSSPVLFLLAFGMLLAVSWALGCRDVRL